MPCERRRTAGRSGGRDWPFGPFATSRPEVHRNSMDARLTQRRLLLCALAIVAFASVTSACGGGSDAQAAPKDPPLSTYTGAGLSFSYPAAWTEYKPALP